MHNQYLPRPHILTICTSSTSSQTMPPAYQRFKKEQRIPGSCPEHPRTAANVKIKKRPRRCRLDLIPYFICQEMFYIYTIKHAASACKSRAMQRQSLHACQRPRAPHRVEHKSTQGAVVLLCGCSLLKRWIVVLPGDRHTGHKTPDRCIKGHKICSGRRGSQHVSTGCTGCWTRPQAKIACRYAAWGIGHRRAPWLDPPRPDSILRV